MTLKMVVRFGFLIIVILGFVSVPILMKQKDVKLSHIEANPPALPFSHAELQELSKDGLKKRLEEIHSRAGVKSVEITPEVLERFQAAINDDTLQREWDELMAVPGRHSSKEWFIALEEFHRKAQAKQVDYPNQARQTQRNIEKLKADIQKTESIITETIEKSAEADRQIAEAIARYEARLAGSTDEASGVPLSPDIPRQIAPIEQLGKSDVDPDFPVEVKQWMDPVVSWNEALKKEYPDSKSREAFSQKLSSEVSRQDFRERQMVLQKEYAAFLQTKLKGVPKEKREQVIAATREFLLKDWDSDFVDAVIEQLQSDEK